MEMHTVALTPEMCAKINELWERLPEPRPMWQKWEAYCAQVPWEHVVEDPARAARRANRLTEFDLA